MTGIPTDAALEKFPLHSMTHYLAVWLCQAVTRVVPAFRGVGFGLIDTRCQGAIAYVAFVWVCLVGEICFGGRWPVTVQIVS